MVHHLPLSRDILEMVAYELYRVQIKYMFNSAKQRHKKNSASMNLCRKLYSKEHKKLYEFQYRSTVCV